MEAASLLDNPSITPRVEHYRRIAEASLEIEVFGMNVKVRSRLDNPKIALRVGALIAL